MFILRILKVRGYCGPRRRAAERAGAAAGTGRARPRGVGGGVRLGAQFVSASVSVGDCGSSDGEGKSASAGPAMSLAFAAPPRATPGRRGQARASRSALRFTLLTVDNVSDFKLGMAIGSLQTLLDAIGSCPFLHSMRVETSRDKGEL